jgi:hypothetical protein
MRHRPTICRRSAADARISEETTMERTVIQDKGKPSPDGQFR